jgi:hypothetical protein
MPIYSGGPGGQYFTINFNTPYQGIIGYNPAHPYFINPNNTVELYEGDISIFDRDYTRQGIL